MSVLAIDNPYTAFDAYPSSQKKQMVPSLLQLNVLYATLID